MGKRGGQNDRIFTDKIKCRFVRRKSLAGSFALFTRIYNVASDFIRGGFYIQNYRKEVTQ